MNTVISKQIMERFYSALDAIIAMKKIRGVNTYCRLNNIDRRNFIAQRKDLERGWFQLSWLYPMVKEYGVSAKWLLTGFGRMFEEQTLLVCIGLFLTNILYHKLASHFLPDFVLSQIINAPVTTIPTVKIAPNISIS